MMHLQCTSEHDFENLLIRRLLFYTMVSSESWKEALYTFTNSVELRRIPHDRDGVAARLSLNSIDRKYF